MKFFPLTLTCKIYEKIHSLVGGHTVADTFMSTLSKHKISCVFYKLYAFFPHGKKGLGLGLGFNSSSITSAMSQVVTSFTLKQSLAS